MSQRQRKGSGAKKRQGAANGQRTRKSGNAGGDGKDGKKQARTEFRQARAQQPSWLEGPRVPGRYEDPHDLSPWPGKLLGLPGSGAGSMASMGQRVLALLIDWLICWGIGFLVTTMTDALGDVSMTTLVVWVIWRIITVWLFGQSPGHALVGIGVARVDDTDKRVGLWRAVVRTVLTVFLFPPLIQDTDRRGMHDRATGTAVIRSR
ncbi:RDD family protein [Corynebacterium nuruki]|uniref:RDD family protein n=1 Tax=Corynebacterium nuruki TaxID=1032851 RepID=UPI0039BF9785